MIDLEKDIQYVKGIGPKKAYKLNKLGIFTLKDLLFYFYWNRFLLIYFNSYFYYKALAPLSPRYSFQVPSP